MRAQDFHVHSQLISHDQIHHLARKQKEKTIAQTK